MSTLMHNPFTAKEDVVFIEYDEIIRSPHPFLLQQIIKHYQDNYRDFIWLEEFIHMDYNNLVRFCIQRQDINVFKSIAKIEFDYDTAWKDLKNTFVDLYMNAPLLPMGDAVVQMMAQKSFKKIFIHTEEYDRRIHHDIQETFQDLSRVTYVTGPFKEVIGNMDHIDGFILRDLRHVDDIFEKNKGEFTNIVVGKFGFNYKLDEASGDPVMDIDLPKYKNDHNFKLGTFIPQVLDDSYFTTIVEG